MIGPIACLPLVQAWPIFIPVQLVAVDWIGGDTPHVL